MSFIIYLTLYIVLLLLGSVEKSINTYKYYNRKGTIQRLWNSYNYITVNGWFMWFMIGAYMSMKTVNSGSVKCEEFNN
jgi:hypothetical protein